jgi:hypothetical protein
MKSDLKTRHGGRILADALAAQGVRMAFGVPGESYLPVLDGLHVGRCQPAAAANSDLCLRHASVSPPPRSAAGAIRTS